MSVQRSYTRANLLIIITRAFATDSRSLFLYFYRRLPTQGRGSEATALSQMYVGRDKGLKPVYREAM